MAVLQLLLLNSASRYYLRQIATLTGLPVRAVQRELARLASAGLLFETGEGNRKYYQADRQASVFPDLRALLLKTAGLGGLLSRHIEDRRGSIAVAILFGSIARGTDTASSDVDLMVIGDVTGREISPLLASPKETLGRELNVVTMTADEFKKKVVEGNPFVMDVLQEPKIFLMGGEAELRELAGRRPAEAA
jgi:predicted nucleotidyltransferase